VGVFACRPLTSDYKSYDPVKKSQWRHCIYQKKWVAALHGKDEFTEEDKSLILAGAELLKNHTHGVWNEAIVQPHVQKLLESWRNANQGVREAHNDNHSSRYVSSGAEIEPNVKPVDIKKVIDALEQLDPVKNIDYPDALTDIDNASSTISSLPEKDREIYTKARIGQGVFRDNLIDHWQHACSVTGCKQLNLLIASHIKPWRDCTTNEAINSMNGLLLIPNLDSLFDKGFEVATLNRTHNLK
jgi:hypothetical protein